MKHYKLNANKYFALIATAGLLVFLTACSPKLRFMQSEIVPAAEGSIKIKKDNNQNYAVEVDVMHLAEPGKLQPPGNTYVVWMETATSGTKNLGQLQISSGLISSTLKASLNTVTSFKPERIFITAEKDAAVIFPNGQTVLTTRQL
jgi:hypothetical protein